MAHLLCTMHGHSVTGVVDVSLVDVHRVTIGQNGQDLLQGNARDKKNDHISKFHGLLVACHGVIATKCTANQYCTDKGQVKSSPSQLDKSRVDATKTFLSRS